MSDLDAYLSSPELLALTLIPQIDALIAAADISGIYDLAPQLAAVDAATYHAIRHKLKTSLGGDWRPLDRIRKGPVLVSSNGNHAPDWRGNLLISSQGKLLAVLANAIIALRHAPEWQGVLAYNEFSSATVSLKPTPWGSPPGPWTDHEDRLAANWLQHAGIMVGIDVTAEAVQAAARDAAFHPVRDYLNSLAWDGEPRAAGWLTTWLGVAPTRYSAAVGGRWLISAVARIFQPGCKADCCLILEGLQGTQKSTALETISSPWFTDEIADLGSKDASMQTMGAWLIEIAELDSMSRAEVSRIKGFMSRATDRFRPPYGRRLITAPRQCVFAGSVNPETYLRDETGNRRFWPVACNSIDIPGLAQSRDQLWAEALTLYREGAKWWLDSSELNQDAATEQEARLDRDIWEDLIARWLRDPSPKTDQHGNPLDPPITSTNASVSMSDILAHCIGKRPDQWTKRDKDSVGRTLRILGWKLYREGSGDRQWRYKPSR